MKKAFFINGGAGRVLCAIPALEYHIQNIDPTAPIIAEGWMELFLTSKIIRNNVYGVQHNGLFDVVKDRELVTPEPYRLNAYFNQKANLIILLNPQRFCSVIHAAMNSFQKTIFGIFLTQSLLFQHCHQVVCPI